VIRQGARSLRNTGGMSENQTEIIAVRFIPEPWQGEMNELGE